MAIRVNLINMFSPKNHFTLPKLHQAIKAKDYEGIRSYIHKGQDLEVRHSLDSRSALNFAIAKKDLIAATLLIEYGANVNSCCSGERPLHLCFNSWNGSIDKAKWNDPKITDNQITEIDNPYREVVQLLVEKGASIKREQGDETSPLQRAAELGNLWAVAFLLKQGASPNERDVNNHTAVHAAAALSHPEILVRLAQEGIDPDVLGAKAPIIEDEDYCEYLEERDTELVSEPRTPTQEATEDIQNFFTPSTLRIYPSVEDALMNISEYYLSDPLKLAVMENDPCSVEVLLALGADPEGNGQPPLNATCYNFRVNDSDELSEREINKKALDIAEKFLLAGVDLTKESEFMDVELRDILNALDRRTSKYLKKSSGDILKNKRMVDTLSARMAHRVLKAQGSGYNSLQSSFRRR